jgi:hypothetical protein
LYVLRPQKRQAHDTKEIASVFLPLTKLVRYLLAIFIASVFATAASIVHATMTRSLFNEFPAVSDPSILEQLETHVRGLPGLKNPRSPGFVPPISAPEDSQGPLSLKDAYKYWLKHVRLED